MTRSTLNRPPGPCVPTSDVAEEGRTFYRVTCALGVVMVALAIGSVAFLIAVRFFLSSR